MLTVTHFKSYLIKTYLLEKGGDMRGLNATQNSFMFFFFLHVSYHNEEWCKHNICVKFL